MMIKDKNGQMSVEVIFLFAISIIILIAFTIPISQLTIENNLDISNSLNTKNELLKLVNGIDNVYSQGVGSKQTVIIETNKEIPIMIRSKTLSGELLLHDNKIKSFSYNHKSDNVNCNLKLEKGINKVLISWPENSKNIVIDKI